MEAYDICYNNQMNHVLGYFSRRKIPEDSLRVGWATSVEARPGIQTCIHPFGQG